MKQQPGWALPDLKAAQIRTKQEAIIRHEQFVLNDEMKRLGAGKYFFLRTYGCQANERDGESIAGMLELMGFLQCEQPEGADLIILNTCAVRKNAEDKVLGELGSLKRLRKEKPGLIFAMCGCMAQEEEIVALVAEKYPHVDLIFGTHNLHHLPQLLYQVMMSHERIIEVFSQEGEVVENLPVKRFGSYKAWVNIMYGCDKFCTYCIVPYTRGKERSRLMEDIVNEIKELVASGYQEVTLLGQNVNSYGKDLGMEGGFAQLLANCAKSGIARIRFMTSHPWDFTMDMIEVIAQYDNIMPFIHLPVQSGDSDMLKIMGRRYSAKQYLALFDTLRKRIPNCAFSTDIIVGFPNESEEQFQHTMDLVEYCRFDNAYTFIYSPREGTPAAQMHDNVPFAIKQERLQRLNALVNQCANERNQAYLGQVVRVLVDGPSKKNPAIYSGYSETNKLVNFPKADVQIGTIVSVRITACKTWSLDGEVIKEK